MAKSNTQDTRQAFLLSFFKSGNHYEVVQVNNFYLEKQISGITNKPIVAIYSKKAWKNKLKYLHLSS
jgi:hypothetical protein